jgi:uncharacterized protein (TIGR04255 family)
MTFPESERVVFRNNPLVEVICQLRFPTILKIASEAPAEYQEKIRSGYPLYEKAGGPAELPPEVSELLARVPIPIPPQSTIHKFLTADSKRFISLADHFVAVCERSYERWEWFRDETRAAQAALEDVYGPAFYSRVGLRYQDVIDKHKLSLGDQPWDSLINRSLIGVLGDPDVRDSVRGIRSDARLQVDEVAGGFLTLRHGLVEEPTGANLVYHIDVDLFTEERSDPKDVSGILDKFNHIAGNLFRWAITPLLRDALGPHELQRLDATG